MLVSLLALGAFVTSLCGCLLATRIEGGKGLLKGLALIFIGLLDSAFVYAFVRSIGDETFVGAVVVIILVAVANAVVAKKWFLEPSRSIRS